jgi:hypothetical protein
MTFTDIQTEFGGTNPISLDEYYAAASGIPSSGAISMNQFYGKSSGISITMGGSSSSTEFYSSILQHGYKQSGTNMFSGTTSSIGSMSNIYVNGGSSGTYVISLHASAQGDGKLNVHQFNLTLSAAATFSGVKLTHADGRSYCHYKGSGSTMDYSLTLIRGFRADGTEMGETERGYTNAGYTQGDPHTAAQGFSGDMVGAVSYNWIWNEKPALNPQTQSEAWPVLQKFAGNIIDKTLTLEWL